MHVKPLFMCSFCKEIGHRHRKDSINKNGHKTGYSVSPSPFTVLSL